MLPLITMLHDEGCNIDMRGDNAKLAGQYGEFADKWDSWLRNHPGVAKYLDPFFVFMQDPGTVPPASLPGHLAAFPAYVTPVLQAPFTQLYTLPTRTDAHATATTLRVCYAAPGGGGGPGVQMNVGLFQTTAPMILY